MAWFCFECNQYVPGVIPPDNRCALCSGWFVDEVDNQTPQPQISYFQHIQQMTPQQRQQDLVQRFEAETERFMHQQYIAMQNQLRPQVTGHS